MQKTLLSVALVAMVAGSANAAVVYNRSVPAGPAQRFNPGAWQGDVDAGLPASTQQMIHWDDIGVDPAAMGSNTALQVTKITIGLRRLANAPANTVNIFASQYNAAATNLDDLLGAAVPPATDFLAGTINLAPVGGANVTEVISLGDGVTPLFTVGLVYGLYTNTNIGGFGLGVQFGNNTPTAAGATSPTGWIIAPSSGQVSGTSGDLLWLSDPQQVGIGAADLGAFNGFGLPAGNNSMYVIIEGNPIPTPGAFAIVGLGGLLAARRRR